MSVVEILRKPNPSDQDVLEVYKSLKERYKSKYWKVVESILESYLAEQAQEDELDALLKETGVEGEAFKYPKFVRIKLLKSQNSKACGELIDPKDIGKYIAEEREEDETGEATCSFVDYDREVKIIPLIRVPYVLINIEQKAGNMAFYRVFPETIGDARQNYLFLKRIADKATKILTNLNDLIDNFSVRKCSMLYFLAVSPKHKKVMLHELSLTPVDSYNVSEFEKKLTQRTGKKGYGAIFSVKKKVVLSSTRTSLKNGNIVISSSMHFDKEDIKDVDSWKVIVIPIVVALKNYISKLPHDISFDGLINASQPSSEPELKPELESEPKPEPKPESKSTKQETVEIDLSMDNEIEEEIDDELLGF